ncbi:hypothetical protein DFH06DRAFT_959093, partial [Mycena polygramma]
AQTIGVAKKCCPLCRLLGDILEHNHRLQLKLPGEHATFFPWVPPPWLRPAILEEMEAHL